MAKPARKRMNRLMELLEVPAAIGSSMVAEPLAGLAGLYGVATGGVGEGVRRIEDVRGKVTYAPRSDVARGALNKLGQLMEPIERGLNYAREGLGDAAYNMTGSPAAATAAHILPDAALSVIGGRQALAAAPRINAAGKQMLERSAGPTMGGPMAQAGAVGDLPANYGWLHRPPMRTSGAPLHDVTGGGTVFPDDVYSPQAAQFYGTGDRALDAATMRLVQSFRGNPDAMIPIYRAVPKGAKASKINAGDWVTINKKYAEMHGGGFDDGFTIIEQRVPARDIYTNGDSIHEWGYDPAGGN